METLKSVAFKITRIGLLVYVGVGALLWMIQGALLFPARATMGTDPSAKGWDFEEVRLPVQGHETFAWYIPLENHRGVVLYSHGNAGNIANRLTAIERLRSFGFSVLAYDYGGYGNSTGSPSEKRCYGDIHAMWNFLLERGMAEDKILLYGRSVGGGPTAELATSVTPGAIILESTFLSTTDVAWGTPAFRPWIWLLRHKFDTKNKIDTFKSPLLILHSPTDEVIPYAHGEGLFQRAVEPKTFVKIKGGHNDGYEFSETIYRTAWEAFLSPILGPNPLAQSVDPVA